MWLTQSAGKSCERVTIGFGFTSDWMKRWRESFKPIASCRKCKTNYFSTLKWKPLYLFQAGSAGLNQQRKFVYWPLWGWLITVIWYWFWNFPITLKQSGYLFIISPLTLRSGFLDKPYCGGLPGSGVAPSGFGPSASVTKKVATDFRPQNSHAIPGRSIWSKLGTTKSWQYCRGVR